MKKSIFKSIALGIGGLLSLSFLLGTGLSNQFINKKDNNNALLGTSVNNQFIHKNYLNTEGTKLPSSGGTLASGTYYLDSDMTLSNYITVATGKNIIINLNGFTLSAKLNSDHQPIAYVKGGTLTINGKDDVSGNMGTLCNGTGYYDGSYTRGGAIAVYADGTNKGNVTVNDCNITNNECNFAGVIFISKECTATLNNCNVSNSITNNTWGYRGVIYAEDVNATININGGEIYNNSAGVLLWDDGNKNASSYGNLNGVYIHDNQNYGVSFGCNDNGNPALTIAGDTIIINNSTSVTSGARPNLRITGNNQAKIAFPSGLGDNASIGINMTGTEGVFTSGWSTYMGEADPCDYFFSDKTDVMIGKNPSGEVLTGVPRTVTYITEHGTAPDSNTVADGSIIYNEPTSPSEEGYAFKGWYKDSSFENAWDFETDTVTADTTLYAKLEGIDPAVANVIQLINDIGDLTYAGGANDSLDDIIAAKTAFDALTPAQKENVVNKDVLDHDILTYRHVDNVGDLIREIPEPSDSQEYYDAIDAALAAYDALAEEEKAILNANLDFQYKKILDDNVAAKEVIELIEDIGDITYNGGQNDSKDDIITAEDAYNNLTEDQKIIVDNANKDVLDDSKESYDKVDETVKLIESIGNVSHGGESDSKEAIDAAKAAYDSLTPEEIALVASYNNSEKVLEDDEAVYGAMEAIDSIGDVTYTTECEEAIEHAQEVYNSLTEDQKGQLGNGYKNVLINAGNKYETVKKQGDILFLILIIVTSLTLVGGIVFLCFLIKKKRKNDDDQDGDNSKGKPVKVYSLGGLVTSLILVSHYLGAKYIILYVLASLAIAVWIACLIIALTIKRKKAIKEEIKPQQVKETKMQENNEDEEEVETITDEKGNIFQIRFIKSFTAKLIQSPNESKKYYEELKNEVLSYKGTHSRISWHFDSVNAGRNYVLKFAIRGKTLCVYLPLDSEKLEDKYKVEKAESKRYEDVPCLYRIKNDRRCGYAKDLIAMVASNLGLEKGEEQHEVYSNLPYEENKPLVARGLIKELKVKVNKPAEGPVVLESKVNSEGDEVVLTKDSSGNLFEIRYIKSFTAKLSQSEAEVKDYYTILKNYVLSYKGVHSRISWHYDAINVSRDYILKFAIRGKTLCVYYALDASKLDKKYKVEEAKGNRYIEVPCLYRIKNDRRCQYAKELVDLLMKEHGLNQGDVPNEDYRIKKESTKALLDKGLIKEVKSKIHDKKVIEHYESITVSKADEVMSDEKAESYIEEVKANKHKEGSKAIINIDTLSEHYNNGDEVTLDSLIEKGLVPSKVGHIKVLARGELDKKLHVAANEYSLQAIKMIVLVGGTVKKIK
ncbi:MAG: uL15 family ribosomal protein [Bacilli bacterium]|nr:uL15 family ribosomal protein [Bacilli bacterium]